MKNHSSCHEQSNALKFYSSKRIEGSGIGLHIVDQYAKRINGEIHLKSEVGVGSAFIVALPLKIASKTDIVQNFISNEQSKRLD